MSNTDFPEKDEAFENFLANETANDENPNEVRGVARHLFYAGHYKRLFPEGASQWGQPGPITHLATLPLSDAIIARGEQLCDDYSAQHPERLDVYRGGRAWLPGKDEVFEEFLLLRAPDLLLMGRMRYYGHHFERLYPRIWPSEAVTHLAPNHGAGRRAGLGPESAFDNLERIEALLRDFKLEYPNRIQRYRT